MEDYWEIEEGIVDSTYFFRLLPKYFSSATTVFIEGTSIEKDVIECYEKHLEEKKYLPGSHTIWPKSKCIRCLFSKEFMNELAQLSYNHAEPELMDHFFIYQGDQALLEWPDVFGNSIFISKSIPEKTISAFSNELGLGYDEGKIS